ncbi:MAG: PIN domain-containing protein [Candidatus Bilamarchaeaceae archaeon]
MDLVVDTNIIVAAILGGAKTRELLFDRRLNLYAPEYMFEEIYKHEKEFLDKSGYEPEKFRKIVGMVASKISVMPKEEYEHHKNEALRITPDKDDWPFIALGLHARMMIWSNDKKLKEQKYVRVVSTDELVKMLACE